MSLRKLPQVKAFTRPENYEWDVPADILAQWTPQAAEADSGATISIFDYIGYDRYDGGGFTAARASAALRSIGPNPIEVRINSGGGDMFEGLTIFNLFREHPAKVTVKVMGMAASAASIIALAADELVMATGSFLMIHNAWGVVVGNRHEMRAAADTFDEFDMAMAEIYQARTGLELTEVQAMMDAETWIRASEAVRKGFADGTTDDPAPPEPNASAQLNARQRLGHILSDAKMPRSERRRLLREATGTQDAAAATTRNAGDDFDAAMSALLASI